MGKTVKRFLALIFCLTFVFLAGCNSGDPTGDWVTTANTEETPVDDTPETDVPTDKLVMREDQVYAADLIDEADTISLAFIGGSLTAAGIEYNAIIPDWPLCGNRWVNNIITYFVTDENGYKIKDKSVKAINVGLPGTTSDYGAVRFMNDIIEVENFAPDIIFLEFSGNDRNWGANGASLYYEYIIRRCLELDKIPIIVIIHAPIPITEADAGFERYMAGIAEKDALAAHYGIKTVNVYDYLVRQYENSGSTLSFSDYIGQGEGAMGYYYEAESASGERYDVHPGGTGYVLFSDAFFEALEADREGTFAKIKFADVYNKDQAAFVDSKIIYTAVEDERISYEGEWTVYKGDNVFETDDQNINMSSGLYQTGEEYYDFRSFPDGIVQTLNSPGASFSFTTSASAVAFPYISALGGSAATAYLVNEDGSNGEVLGSVTCQSIYDEMNYLTYWVNLPDDGKEHTVRFVVDEPTETNYVFRFGYLVERFDKK